MPALPVSLVKPSKGRARSSSLDAYDDRQEKIDRKEQMKADVQEIRPRIVATRGQNVTRARIHRSKSVTMPKVCGTNGRRHNLYPSNGIVQVPLT